MIDDENFKYILEKVATQPMKQFQHKYFAKFVTKMRICFRQT